MRIFLKKTFLFASILFIQISLLFLYRIIVTRNISWKLSDDIHVLFMGASHIQRGINDSIYLGSINLAEGSERYLFTYLKLIEVLKYNPQIDTIILEFAPTDIWENTDTKYYSANEMSKFLPLYFPFFSLNELHIYSEMNKQDVLTALLNKVYKDIPKNIYSFGKFSPSTKTFDRNRDKYKMPVWVENDHFINYKYLYKIIDTCIKNEITIVFIYMPMFEPHNFYDQEYFYKSYNRNFSTIKLLDYSKWDCPDNYRADEHHLNIIGANIFTSKLFKDMHSSTGAN